MGIVTFVDGQPMVLEAVSTVRLTPYVEWVARGELSHVVVKRLEGDLTRQQLRKMRQVGQGLAGRPYDLQFMWSDDRVYCSELVYKIYERGAGVQIGQVQQFKDFDLGDRAVRQKVKERFGGRVPLDEPVISPASMFDDGKLLTVYRN
jgi:uncharacterized protein YycO